GTASKRAGRRDHPRRPALHRGRAWPRTSLHHEASCLIGRPGVARPWLLRPVAPNRTTVAAPRARGRFVRPQSHTHLRSVDACPILRFSDTRLHTHPPGVETRVRFGAYRAADRTLVRKRATVVRSGDAGSQGRPRAA